MTAAQSLPRFLLPRLSWTGPSGSITGASAALLQQARDSSNASLSRQPPHKRTYHTSGSSKGTPTTIPKRSLTAHFRASPPCFSQNQGRPFSTTPSRQRDHHFDTLRFVQRLQEEGFTEEQAVAMMKVLNDVIEERYPPCPPSLLQPHVVNLVPSTASKTSPVPWSPAKKQPKQPTPKK